ncbi:hypothetical protein [Actinobacillus capsulatus]|uniref:hypothetical protein n=1 Tax=Actinobacillus capsulatus TaxID=717 RepID=UPI0003633D70|nr:hypothetical protein [Actinobacillus capsulatus]
MGLFKLSKGRITLLLFLALMGYGVYWYFFESSFYVGEPDYSKTQWRTFYGKKTPGYLPEYWTTYFTDKRAPNCQESFNITFEGEPVARKQYREFVAEEQDDGKTYVIRYPDNYWIGNCEYRSYSGQFYVEEKSDDPRLRQEPYNNKNQYYRFTLIRGGKIADFSLRHDSYLEERSPDRESKTYLNQPNYDVFCFKWLSTSMVDQSKDKYGVSCESYENPKKHTFKPFVFYTPTYWKEHPDIELNLKISNKTYCWVTLEGEQQCRESQNATLPKSRFDWKIKKEWFEDFYNEQPNSDIP